MNPSFLKFLKLPDNERRDVFEAAADRLDTLDSYVEKDFWVCLVMDALYNGLPAGHPKLLLKGGTSLSKAFSLIRRFSEDVDIVVSRHDLGFTGNQDPADPQSSLSNKKRGKLFDELISTCSAYIVGDLISSLSSALETQNADCPIEIDPNDEDKQTLLVQYPSLFPAEDVSYVQPRVKIEGGARSALDPNVTCEISPYIQTELSGWALAVRGITAIKPERTFWEKALILHGAYCGFRDEGRTPSDRHPISRHYYDVAMISATKVGNSALENRELWDSVREHNLIVFRQAWKKFEEAVPGTTHLLPESDLRTTIEKDYDAMQDMILGNVPPFDWIMERLVQIEAQINKA